MSQAAAITFRRRIDAAIKARAKGNLFAAAREAGLEGTTLYYYMKRERGLSLRSFALLCTWAQIDPGEVIQEFTL